MTNRFNKMREYHDGVGWSNFCAGIGLFILFGGFGVLGLCLYGQHINVGYTIGNGLQDDVVVLGRLSVWLYVLGLMGAVIAIVEWVQMVNATKK